ncbi:malate dehydrogenase, NAD-dependent [Rubidibacter lacunae KORDI 51-2]|uniref:Malate dehydrogenase n=1 Tax=Rubidibacter lacunae KORDI 51-2 TaxID=582515 RepID=U5DC01_9CHRO|nr:malate dehydrogenase, NAD-dependent [Rubidibacter lacunae KORDI 51-2]
MVDRSPLVSIVGAGKVGSTLAQRLIEKHLADVVLVDIAVGLPQGIALDLLEARSLEGHDRHICGTNDFADTAGSDVIVITAGLPRKPGMSRDDLIATNARIVVDVTRQAIARSPEAILIVVTNPLDVMAYLAWETAGVPPQQVLGMAGGLDSARLQTFIALELNVDVAEVSALVLGGHGDLMVPLPRYCTVRGVPITELLDEAAIARLVERTRNGGAEIVQLLKTGGAFYAPASATYQMVEAIVHDRARLMPAATYLNGEYGITDLFVGVPCFIDRRGAGKIHELSLTAAERHALHTSAESVRTNLAIARAALENG